MKKKEKIEVERSYFAVLCSRVRAVSCAAIVVGMSFGGIGGVKIVPVVLEGVLD